MSLEYENLMSKEERIQVALGTMEQWEVLVQKLVAPYEARNAFMDIALLVVAGKDKMVIINATYVKDRLKELIENNKQLRILFRRYKSNDSYVILNRATEYYYTDVPY